MLVNNLSDLQVFNEIVKLGSFQAAAQKLGLSAAVTSKRLQRLESQLGVALIVRSTRSLSVTEEGKIYFKHCQYILSAAEEAETEVLHENKTPKGKLSVSVPAYFGRLYIAPLIPKFLQKYPEITLSIDFSDQFVDIVDEGYDLVVRIGELQDSSLIATKLATDQRVVVAAPNYISKFGKPDTPQDLIKHNILLFANPTPLKIWDFFDANKQQQHIKVDGNFQTNSCEGLNEATMAGLGIALRPRWDVHKALESGKLVELLPNFSTPKFDIQAVYPNRTHLSYRVRVFIDELKQSLKQQIQWHC